jgi:hypothetical protein
MAKPILEHSPEGSSGEIDPGEIAGAIEISQVSFSYPDGDPVLDDVSISIPAGSFHRHRRTLGFGQVDFAAPAARIRGTLQGARSCSMTMP